MECLTRGNGGEFWNAGHILYGILVMDTWHYTFVQKPENFTPERLNLI